LVSDETRQALLTFRAEREWEQFHSPLNLAVAIAVEAGELLEQFQWRRPGDDGQRAGQEEAVAAEMADVAILLTYLAHDLGVDLEQAVKAKLAVNAQRYPVERARGRATKHDAL
jgi:NTP pyrophosphatase (non-canonical NTP hydrolase)